MRKLTRKKIIIISVVAVVSFLIFLSIYDIFIDPPAWWRLDRQMDKMVILDYVKETYPDNIKRKGSKFPLQMPAGPYENSFMFFELDGIGFAVSAINGVIVADGYPRARANAQFNKIIQDGFFKPRGLTASSKYSYLDDYKETYPYVGGLGIQIWSVDHGGTPQEVGWIYDFYEYWKTEGAFLKEYRVDIYIWENQERKWKIAFNNNSEFESEDEFYTAIERNNGYLISD